MLMNNSIEREKVSTNLGSPIRSKKIPLEKLIKNEKQMEEKVDLQGKEVVECRKRDLLGGQYQVFSREGVVLITTKD